MGKKSKRTMPPRATSYKWRELGPLGGVATRCGKSPYIVTTFSMVLDFNLMPVKLLSQLREEIIRGWHGSESSETAVVTTAVLKQIGSEYCMSILGSAEARVYLMDAKARKSIIGELVALQQMSGDVFSVTSDSVGVYVKRSKEGQSGDGCVEVGEDDEDGEVLTPVRRPNPRGWGAIRVLMSHHLDASHEKHNRLKLLEHINILKPLPITCRRM